MTTARRRLAVARFWFEGNSFAPRPTTQAQFQAREWQAGAAALQAAEGTDAELAAVAAFARAQPDWTVSVSHACSAHPGGPVPRADFEDIVTRIVAPLRGPAWDAVYLSLHGAAVVDGVVEPERQLVQAVRDAVGPAVPIGASFDLHANAPPWDLLQAASVYRTYPHVDMADTARRVLAQLARIAAGAPWPRALLRPLQLRLPSFQMRTAAGPMADLLALAARLQAAQPEALWDLAVFGGFPYADVPQAGASVAAIGPGSAALLEAAVATLAGALQARAGDFDVRLPDARAGLLQALAAPPGLVAVTDPADNPYSGGAADTPGLLAALLQWRADEPAARVPTLLAYLADPAAVAAAHSAGTGSRLELSLGGHTSTRFGAPVAVSAQVLRLCQARFTHRGPMEQGQTFDLGRSAALDIDGLQLIVTEQAGPANDPAFFDAHDIALGELRLLCVKAKNHFRAAFEPLCSAIVDVDLPGPAMADLGQLPFRHRPDAPA
ncbi:MAG: M81 family metallopeptidase [Aquabacterium sp.]